MQIQTSPAEQEKQLDIIKSDTAKLHEIDRTRRTLTEALSDTESDVARQQDEIARLAAHLGDAANDGIERQIADARAGLKKLHEAKKRAASALEAFQRKNPTPEELRARQEELQATQGQLEQEQLIERMKENVRQSFALFFKLEKLQQERAAIYTEAVDRWPSTEPGRARHAGLKQTITGWFPSLFGDYGELRAALELAGEWDLELVPDSHPARDAVIARANQAIAPAYFRPGIKIGNV
jgi:chromosome segregation ATPase